MAHSPKPAQRNQTRFPFHPGRVLHAVLSVPEVRSELRCADLKVLWGLATFADWATGASCWPSTTTLAERSGCDQKTVRTAIKRLIERGLVSREWRSKPHSGRAGYVYRLALPRGAGRPGKGGETPDRGGQEARERGGERPPDPSLDRSEKQRSGSEGRFASHSPKKTETQERREEAAKAKRLHGSRPGGVATVGAALDEAARRGEVPGLAVRGEAPGAASALGLPSPADVARLRAVQIHQGRAMVASEEQRSSTS